MFFSVFLGPSSILWCLIGSIPNSLSIVLIFVASFLSSILYFSVFSFFFSFFHSTLVVLHMRMKGFIVLDSVINTLCPCVLSSVIS